MGVFQLHGCIKFKEIKDPRGGEGKEKGKGKGEKLEGIKGKKGGGKGKRKGVGKGDKRGERKKEGK